MDQFISLQKVPSLNFDALNSRPQGQKKQLRTQTTRQYQLANQKSCSYLKSNRSFTRKGIYSHRLVEDVQDMQEQEFIKKYSQNPFFKTQVNVMLKDYSLKNRDNTLQTCNENVTIEQEYQLKTLKSERVQIVREGQQIQTKWLSWLNNAGIKFTKK